MSQYVHSYANGEVRMDFHTFQRLKVDRIVETIEANAKRVTKHVRRPVSAQGKVKEFL